MKHLVAFGVPCFLFLMLTASTTGQGPSLAWSKTFGDNNWDEAFSLVQTSDGGYVLAGYTMSSTGDYDFWLVKTDSSGNEEWNKTFGGPSRDEAHSIIQTSDGGYVLAGYTESYGAGGKDFWLVKTDSSGNEEWNKTFGGPGDEWAYSVIQTSDGGYAIAGYTESYSSGPRDLWLVKTDSSGNEEWNKTFGGPSYEWAKSIIQTSDGGYVLAGCTESYGDFAELWLVKTDSSGNEEWNKTFGDDNWEEAYSVIQTSDGGYAIAGCKGFGVWDYDFWLVKTDSSGNEEWNKTFGDNGREEAYSVIQTSDGGYVLAGYTDSYGAGCYDLWLVKTDSSGNEEWNKTFGDDGFEWANSIIQTSDGGYALAGSTNSYGAVGQDFWLVKTNPLDNVEIDSPEGGGVIYVVGAVVGIIVVLALILYKRHG